MIDYLVWKTDVRVAITVFMYFHGYRSIIHLSLKLTHIYVTMQTLQKNIVQTISIYLV